MRTRSFALAAALSAALAFAAPAAAQQTPAPETNGTKTDEKKSDEKKADEKKADEKATDDESADLKTWLNERPITMQNFRPVDRRGINMFETPKDPGVEYTGFKFDINAAFTSQV